MSFVLLTALTSQFIFLLLEWNSNVLTHYERRIVREMSERYRTGALLGACAYTSTGNKYALIREMRLIKSAFFNAGILRTAAKYALNSLITRQYGNRRTE